MTRIAEYTFNRKLVYGWGIPIGILFGLYNMYSDMGLALDAPAEMIQRWGIEPTYGALVGVSMVLTIALVFGAVVIIALFHECMHGLAALLLKHKPIMGCKLPLVYITFPTKIPLKDFLVIALAPLIILDSACLIMFFLDIIPLFAWVCFIANSVGAMGDVWMVGKAMGHKRTAMIQDTKWGFEVWDPDLGKPEQNT